MSRERRMRQMVTRWTARGTALAAEGFLRGAARVGRLHPAADPSVHGVVVDRDVPYLDTGHPRHRLDVYHPPTGTAKGDVPIVFYVHGGGFQMLSKDTHWAMALAYARRGYLVFNINYRLARRYPFPTSIEDVCAAYAWVIANAARYGGDTASVVVAGESAGANLVTALTVATCYERSEPYARVAWNTETVPKAVVPACGILQTSAPERFLERWPRMSPTVYSTIDGVCRGYLRGDVHSRDAAFDLASPLLLLERGMPPQRSLPAFFVPCGTADPLIDDAERLDVALGRLGVEREVRFYKDEVHAFHALMFRPGARRCWADTYRFLDRHVRS